MSFSRVFPGFDHVYEIGGPYDFGDERTFFASLDISNIDDRALQRGEWLPEKPLQAKWSFGPPQPSGIVGGGAPGIIFISKQVQRFLEEYKLTGWSTYPILLYDQTGKVCHGFTGLSITGRCGPIDEERGEMVPGQAPNTSTPYFRGIFFDESTWDGSDFFTPQDGGGTFVTEAVKRAFEENGITDFDFTPLTESEYMGIDEDIDDEVDEDAMLGSLYMDQELDPAGFVTPKFEPALEGVGVDYTVIYPYDNNIGKKFRVCSTFDEAKAFVLHLQAQGVEHAMILRNHQLIWSTGPV